MSGNGADGADVDSDTDTPATCPTCDRAVRRVEETEMRGGYYLLPCGHPVHPATARELVAALAGVTQAEVDTSPSPPKKSVGGD